MVRKFLSLRWILTTILAILAIAVMIRLGFWQLDRLAQRRAFNARVTAQQTAPTLDLGSHLDDPGLTQMEYRQVEVTGEYDFSQQIAWRNQVANGQPGFHLLTPLVIQGSNETVLVDRGWIPLEDAKPDQWAKYDEPGLVTVHGVIRYSMPRRGIAGVPDPTLEPGQDRLAVWNFIDLNRIAGQLNRKALPVYVQELPDPSRQTLPLRSEPELDLSEGPHLGYAIQWFSFAAILTIGYPIFVYRQLSAKEIRTQEKDLVRQGEEEG